MQLDPVCLCPGADCALYTCQHIDTSTYSRQPVYVQAVMSEGGSDGESIASESDTDEQSDAGNSGDRAGAADSESGSDDDETETSKDTDGDSTCGNEDDAAIDSETESEGSAGDASDDEAGVQAHSAAGAGCSSAQVVQNPTRRTVAASAAGVDTGSAKAAGCSDGSSGKKRQSGKRQPRGPPTRDPFLNALVKLGRATEAEVAGMDDFVVSDPDRDYVELCTRRYSWHQRE